MKVVTYNALADAYTSYGDYSHTDPDLLTHGARIEPTIQLLQGLDADVLGIQEADEALVASIRDENQWQIFWTPKGRNKPDGCLTLVKNGIDVESFQSIEYSDGSGHVAQIIKIGGVAIANTHIKWAPSDSVDHVGVAQARELVTAIDTDKAVLLADCNDKPGGPVRKVVEDSGFVDLAVDFPTALVDQEPVAIDLLAVRGMRAKNLTRNYDLHQIPNRANPSDHIPVEAELGSVL